MTKEEKRKIRETRRLGNFESDVLKIVRYDVDNDDLDFYQITFSLNKTTGETIVYKEYYENTLL